MEIRAAEISDLIKRQIGEYGREVEVRETGRVLSTGDGIARIYGLDKAAMGELLEFPHDIYGMVLNLEEDNVGAALFGETARDQRRRRGPPHRPHRRGAGRRGPARPRGQRARPADRRQGPDRDAADAAASSSRRPASSSRQPVKRAAADRHQGHRLDDPDRPRPARADHRRPPDRQDRHRHRHDHQPEGRRRRLHLRRHRPEALDRRAGRRPAHASTARWSTPSSSPRRRPIGAAAVHRALHRLHHGRVLPRQRPPRPDHLRRSLEAGRRLPPAVAAAAPSAGPRSVSRRRLLPALAPARARRQDERRPRAAAR